MFHRFPGVPERRCVRRSTPFPGGGRIASTRFRNRARGGKSGPVSLPQCLWLLPLALLACGGRSDEDTEAGTGKAPGAAPAPVRDSAGVPWNPWDGQTLQRAQDRELPLLLYFSAEGADGVFPGDDPSVRYLIEQKFTAIRVNPFQRPDLARRYASRGWPALAFLLPDGSPVSTATDLPARNARTWLMHMADHYEKRRGVLVKKAARGTTGPGATPLSAAGVFAAVAADYDSVHGGFGGPEKFPELLVLHFLLQYNRFSGDGRAREMWLATVKTVLQSPMWDARTGGICSFSYTPDWTTPSGARDAADQAGLVQLLLAGGEADPEVFTPLLDRQLAFVRRELYDGERRLFHGRQVRVENGAGEAAWWTDRTAYAGRNARLVLALFDAAAQLEQRQWGELALGAAEALLALLVDADGRVAHCRPAGCASGLLTDQLLVSRALWRAHRWSGESRFRQAAERTLRWTEENLYDSRAGGFRDALGAGAPLQAWEEQIPFEDEIHPSGNAIAVEVYLDHERADAAAAIAAAPRIAGSASRVHAGMAAAMMRREQIGQSGP